MSKVDQKEGCVFCDCAASPVRNDRDNLIIHRSDLCFAILNLYPYSSGHVMVAPYAHTSTIEHLEEEVTTEMMALAKRCMAAIRSAVDPDGFNLGMNIARVAGAGIADHVHLHVVPRWSGDSNFMSVVAQTRVLPLSLDQVWEALSSRLAD